MKHCKQQSLIVRVRTSVKAYIEWKVYIIKTSIVKRVSNNKLTCIEEIGTLRENSV